VKTQNINLIRGDTNTITFKIIGENGEKYTIDDKDKLYFTVKENYFENGCVLQKTYGKGISFNTETEEYEVEFTSECTCNLPFGRFVYDIELVIIRDGKKIVKTLCKGKFTVDKEVTCKENES
jgi:hypothetical protein